MATFLSRREAQERARQEKEQRRQEKLYFSDLWWAAGRRWLSDEEWYDLHKLSLKYSKYGPERLEYEIGRLEEMRGFFQRHHVNSKDSTMNALERHIALFKEQEEKKKKAKSEPMVYAHPDLKKLAKK